MNVLYPYKFIALVFTCACMLWIIGAPAARAAPEDRDARMDASRKIWDEQLKPANFKDRPIIEGAGNNVIEIKAPFRAEDAAIVPISIHSKIPQTPDLYIQKLHVFIDKNPLPLVGIFEFSPASGKADIAMRVRVDDFSFVRAIAELNTGELYMAEEFVRSLGGCSAPPGKSIDDSVANMGKMKIQTAGELEFAKPNLVQLSIKHPNITGLQPLRVGSRVRPPAHFIKDVKVDYEGQPVMKAQLTFAISMDPSFRFFFVPEKEGVMAVEAVDTKDNRWVHTHEIGGS